MHNHDATETAYRNGYEAGKRDAVKHGEWVHTDYAKHWLCKDECSACGWHKEDRRDMSWAKHCPNCGAKMDGGKET